jgi:hypothetical protein
MNVEQEAKSEFRIRNPNGFALRDGFPEKIGNKYRNAK